VTRLRLAITKGRLLDSSITMFEKMGYDCSELKNPGRRLLLSMGELDIVLAKAPDVVTCVELGACALGIAGKDTLMEHGGSFYEVLDLGFGKCRFALAAPEGTELFGGYRTPRVASKYPRVAREYFLSKNMDVSVIKIEGSVELAPILGLADGIVDIVESGNTLKANGLRIIEEICPVSARLIVNSAAMKLYKGAIMGFIAQCREAVR